MFFVYILQSEQTRRYYIGHTGDVQKRLTRHNKGRVHSTKHGSPWKVVRIEKVTSKNEAIRREREIKSYKSGIKFKKLINQWRGG
ncbi:MAG: GIY-YIG nuclease family protein [Candidatus Pacebacteria bacterium]|nr:GIY-YIG nuclease family protein [Candidatus Paceibacterota bacterium]